MPLPIIQNPTEHWVALWKRHYSQSDWRQFVLEIGVHQSSENLLEATLSKCLSDPEWRRRWFDGAIYPVPVHLRIDMRQFPGSDYSREDQPDKVIKPIVVG